MRGVAPDLAMPEERTSDLMYHPIKNTNDPNITMESMPSDIIVGLQRVGRRAVLILRFTCRRERKIFPKSQ